MQRAPRELIYFETYGCTLNRADTALMKSIALDRGYGIAETPEEAEVIVINTCTVRLDTEIKMLKRLRELYELFGRSKRIVVAGCMVAAQPYTIKRVAPKAVLVSPQNIVRFLEAVESRQDLILGERDVTYLKPYVEGVVAAVPIAEGCVGQCSFCITKIARRRLRSYRAETVVKAVEEAVRRGAVEIELAAQDSGCYGLDIGSRLPDLIREVLDRVEGNYMLRIGMANPDTVLGIVDELIEVLREPRVYKYLHIPMQSADDRVLKLMKRRYTYDEFKYLILELRRKVVGVSIATDVIVGHPGEDDEAFERTVRAVEELQFDKVHVAQYTIRPRTESAAMKQVPEEVKKLRSSTLAKVVERVGLGINQEYVGSLAKVLVTHRSIRGSAIGRTYNYKPVVLLGGETSYKLGGECTVFISSATFFDLRGYASS